MKAVRMVLAAIRKADETYNLINHGDKIVVGLSGGKDSVALVYALSLYQKFSHTDFIIQPVTLDLGFDNFDATEMKDFCASLGLNLIVHDAREVYPILKAHQDGHEHLPCSICSRMKKAAINKVTKDLGFNKVAFAHHMDDAIETLFMNEMFGGRVATFAPKMHLERADIEFIRPLILSYEKDITRFVKEENLPVVSSHCPADKYTKREEVKELLHDIYHKYPMAKDNFQTMLSNYEKEDIWGKEIYMKISQEGLTLKPVVTPLDMMYMNNIRKEVFLIEQNINPNDEFVVEEELESTNYLVYLNEKPIGCMRYRLVDDKYKIERFAILKEYRNKGYGQKAFSFLCDLIFAKFNPCTITINAQEYIIPFYEKIGFIKEGDIFLEAGIRHQRMYKKDPLH